MHSILIIRKRRKLNKIIKILLSQFSTKISGKKVTVKLVSDLFAFFLD